MLSTTPHQPTTPTKRDDPVPRRGIVIAAAMLPLLVLIVLYAANVPLGRPDTTGYVVYRYSPIVILRVYAGVVGLAIGLCGLLALGCCFFSEKANLVPAKLAVALGYVGLIVWTFFAPPSYVDQHSFNMLSPSQDGAFVLEGRSVTSIRDYLSRDYYQRLRATPEDMRGRRILSNPPAATVASILVQRIVDAFPRCRAWLIQRFHLDGLDDPVQQREFAAALVLCLGFTLAWGLALWPAYGLCRLWMPASLSGAVAFACVVNPATVAFTPGKDPAQLLTVMAVMYFWMRGVVRDRPWWAFASGAALAVGTMVSLIHIWIFAIVGAATFWHGLGEKNGSRRWVIRYLLPAILGGLSVAAVAQVTLGWNIIKTAVQVALRYGEIQPNIITDPFYWTLIGLPTFLLFVGPLFWIMLITARRAGSISDQSNSPNTAASDIDNHDLHDTTPSETTLFEATKFGRSLLVCAIAVMTYAYFFANNNEIPRLWIPFIPLLLVGMALRRPVFFVDSRVSRKLCLLLIGLQLVVTIVHWSLLDVRESEYRLISGRMWD